mgnify:CR=1 FL=1
MKINRRVRAVIVKDDQILLIHRIKKGNEYFVVPGGGIEEGETEEETLVREVKEETSIDVNNSEKLFVTETIDNNYDEVRIFTFFLVTDFTTNKIEIGGPEKERNCEENQYYLEWHDIDEALNLPNFYKDASQDKIKKYLSNYPVKT